MTEQQGMFEDWLDGRLSPEEAARFEERIVQEPELAREARLARQVDGSLKRSFSPPSAAAIMAAIPELRDADAAPQVEQASGGPSIVLPLVFLAAAAVLVSLLPRSQEPFVPEESLPVAEAVATGPDLCDTSNLLEYAPDWSLDTCVGPMVATDTEQMLTRVQRPDLEAIYRSAEEWTSDSGWRGCGPGEDLASKLASTYDTNIEMEPEAAGKLQGPFSSTEWPTGTILAGRSEGRTSVVVAERDSVHACCLELETSDDGDLNVFTWSIGEVVLTEISPLEEPHLLNLFAAYSDPVRSTR